MSAYLSGGLSVCLYVYLSVFAHALMHAFWLQVVLDVVLWHSAHPVAVYRKVCTHAFRALAPLMSPAAIANLTAVCDACVKSLFVWATTAMIVIVCTFTYD